MTMTNMISKKLKAAIEAATPKGKRCRLFLADWDGTVTNEDTTTELNRKFGSVDKATGLALSVIVRQQHAQGTMTLRQHMRAEVLDVHGRTPVDEVLAHVQDNVLLREGLKEWLRVMRGCNVHTIVLSNGLRHVTRHVIKHNKVPIKKKRIISNRAVLNGRGLAEEYETLSGEKGLDKAAVFEYFHCHPDRRERKPVVGVAGDSPGDFDLFAIAGKCRVPIFIPQDASAAVEWCRSHLRDLRGGFVTFQNWMEVWSHLQPTLVTA
jgi:2-hydroxy-3-keto-5-methylthiopentenyl-1-phosphate phosphatase